MRLEFEAGTNFIDNAEVLRVALKRNNVEVIAGPGTYDFGNFQTVFGQNVSLRGSGMGKTIFECSALGGMCAWEPNYDTRIENLTMMAPYGQGKQSQVFGFQRTSPTPPVNANVWIYSVEMVGGAFALYSWTAPNVHIMAYASLFTAGGWGVTAGGSSGAAAQTIDLWNCDVNIDRMLYPSADASQGSQSAGVVARGGVLNMFGGSIHVKGGHHVSSTGDIIPVSAIGALTTPAPNDIARHPYDWPYMLISGVSITIDANGSLKALETEQQIGTLTRK